MFPLLALVGLRSHPLSDVRKTKKYLDPKIGCPSNSEKTGFDVASTYYLVEANRAISNAGL